MKTGYTAYTEAVYKEQEDGTVHWQGRVYNRVGPAKVLETQDGVAPDRDAALVAVKDWSVAILESGYRSREVEVITTDDVATLNVSELGLE